MKHHLRGLTQENFKANGYLKMTPIHFHQEHARAARRALATGNADAYMKRYATKLVRKGYDLDLVNRYTLVMEPLLKEHCIAKAEDLAINEVLGKNEG